MWVGEMPERFHAGGAWCTLRDRMRLDAGTLVLSATDLSNFLNCRHRTALEIGEARGAWRRAYWTDPLLQALVARGLQHERSYVAALRAAGKDVLDLGGIGSRDEALAATRAAMRNGADVIVQAAVGDDRGRWFGRPDVLLRVATPSALGEWSYEVADTKLALETRAGTILQLGLYCDLLAAFQHLTPAHFYIVTPDNAVPGSGAVRTYRVNDYAAYFRRVRRTLEAFIASDVVASGAAASDAVIRGATASGATAGDVVAGDVAAGDVAARDVADDADAAAASATYPEPVDHCDVCAWSSRCREQRRGDDHLSLVAGITGIQRRELQSHAINTVEALARTALPLPFKPRRGSLDAYVRVREQARVQVEARVAQRPVFELLQPIEAGKGLCRLPEPSPGDLFLDLEGDPFAGESGREYLFGLVSLDDRGQPVYQARWAVTMAEEARAFAEVVSIIMDAWAAHPGMHVYHYAPYEPAALRRLMGRFAAREQEIDSLLRAERFVDLYAVVRQGLRAGVERYSIKSIEPLYGFARAVPLLEANRSLRIMEQALELDLPDLVTQELRDVIQGYNHEDCTSALRLREWLEGLRDGMTACGQQVPRPALEEDDASENVTERAQRVEALRARLLAGVPIERQARDADQQARWLLAYLLDWHRRENKAGWWEYFRLLDLPDDALFDEPQAIAGLVLVERVNVIVGKSGKPTGSVIDRYRYPIQEMEIRRGDELKLKTEKKFGDVVAVDRATRTIEIRKGPKMAEEHPASVFEHKYVSTDVIEDAILAIGDRLAPAETETPLAATATGTLAPLALARRLLRADPPSTISGTFDAAPHETAVDVAVRVVGDLDESVLAIQGPPGAGKTFTGARMICALVQQGKRVGVMATGHTVIKKLLNEVAKAAAQGRQDVKLAHKPDEPYDSDTIRQIENNHEAAAALASGEVNVMGGTAWLWTRPELARSVDVLFVDEAGQMSLANALAVTHATRSLVLLGDPQQLEQPKKGTHPEGVGVSALQHLLGPHATIPPDRGIFLPETWRLAPAIASFTSEVFYEGRLRAKPGLERQALIGTAYTGHALWVTEVPHEGNRNACDEEVEEADRLVTTLTAPGSRWIDEHGHEAPITGSDILIVAPFNAQVSRLTERLARHGVSVGTVDKFQGQEAPIVIYSMATSSPEDAPRGLEFLYSLNRLNVATSRARCAVFLIASPRLFGPDCKTPRQIALANALCRYRELATVITPAANGHAGQMASHAGTKPS
jgi:predicted RecB family nuclease